MSNAFTSRPEAGRRGYHHGNLRESLIDAARFLIAERGPQGFTLIEAARLVDVSPAAPYRHFKDRDALVEAVAERGFTVFAERLREAHRAARASAEGGADAIRPLQRMGAAYLAFSREEPGYYGAMFLAARAGRPPGGQAFALLTEAVQQAVAPGGSAAGAEATAMQIWALPMAWRFCRPRANGPARRAPLRRTMSCSPEPRRSSPARRLFVKIHEARLPRLEKPSSNVYVNVCYIRINKEVAMGCGYRAAMAGGMADDQGRWARAPLFRSGWEIGAMVGGFVVFFPVGLAILAISSGARSSANSRRVRRAASSSAGSRK